MSSSLTRVAAVTGGSSGIGEATADLFTRQGYVTVRLSRRLSDGVHTARCDVRSASSVAKAFRRILQRFGRLDVLVNCAGIASFGDPLRLTTEEWEQVLGTNLLGTFLCCQQALRPMQRQRYGRIVNIASIAARSHSASASVAYTSSKYGVVGLTRQLAAQFGRGGLTVNCVCPSETLTEMLQRRVSPARRRALAAMHPLGRLGRPEEVAHVIAFLASEDASFVNGAVVDVNGGLL